MRDKRSAFHPHGGTCMGKLLLPSTTWYASGPALLVSMAASLLARGRISNPLKRRMLRCLMIPTFSRVGETGSYVCLPAQTKKCSWRLMEVIYSMLLQVWDGNGVLEPLLLREGWSGCHVSSPVRKLVSKDG